MTISRRTILRAGTAGLAAGLFAPLMPRRGWAAATLSLGAARIDTLSDGHLVLPMSFVTDHEGAGAVMAELGISGDAVEPPCNVTLLRDGTNTVLFDVGSGHDFMPTAGKLAEAMDALGVTAQEITHVVFTHAHPDHLWGLLDEFDEPIFADATFMIGKAEWDYWMDPATVDTIGAERQSFAVGAQRRLAALEDRIVTFGDGEEIIPGVAARATFGHTPGHMAYEIRNGSDACMVLGDCIGNHHLAFARPDWMSGSDQDPDTGIATRVKLLDQLAAEQMRIVGFHLPDGGLGRVERAGDAYRFVAEGS
ncbi:MBL fold metallo-hydrolase [Pontitalea aquivivens]|uniref:MBL fold metallo-hydrolase n=1 Tax=Pontitalea aquivivens TaxID=3388663 RepID=UPI00397061CD